MTGATSTVGGGGGAEARTLPLLHPSALSSNTALTNAVVILFIFEFPFVIASLARLNDDAARFVCNGSMVVLSIQARQSRDSITRFGKHQPRSSEPTA